MNIYFFLFPPLSIFFICCYTSLVLSCQFCQIIIGDNELLVYSGCKDIDDALHCTALPNGNFEVGIRILNTLTFYMQ